MGITSQRAVHFFCIWLALAGTTIAGESEAAQSSISVRWELISNFTSVPNGFDARFMLENRGEQPLGDTGWDLFFNMAPRPIHGHPEGQKAKIHHLNGDWYRLSPEPGFRLEVGETVEIRYSGIEAVIKESDAPLGLYFVFEGDQQGDSRIETVSDYRIMPFSEPHQINRGPNDQQPIPTPQWQYQENLSLDRLPAEKLPPIIPTPIKVEPGKGSAVLDRTWAILFADDLDSESQYLAQELAERTGLRLDRSTLTQAAPTQERRIELRLQPTLEVNGVRSEAYSLQIDESRIQLVGNDSAGVFYAIQSLFCLLPVAETSAESTSVRLPEIKVSDAPRFGYRGLHVDVSRNFQSKETMERILDAMALYKLNRLLFYTTEDEGWRVEIPGLPELTEVGGQRAHNEGMHAPSLHPAYGSGPIAYAAGSHGSGFYTRDEFVALLKYAKQRHIKVIPEVNFPGHARAAIKAMEARYQRLANAGDLEAAEEYRLIDPQDQSEYLSAQAYKDNVVSVARPSTYRFYHKVLDELSLMYQDAGLVMDEIHTGGDEVPVGSWTQSPMAARLLQENPDIDGVENLQTYFFRRLLKDLDLRGLKALGWEEVFQRKNAEGQAEPNPEFVGRNVVAYIWNNLFDYDLGNRLANIGYPVILCNVSNFYFDLAYDKDPKEPGLYWAGFVGPKDAFLFAPYNYLVTTFRTSMGQPIDIDQNVRDCVPLSQGAAANILGVQAQLWSETIKGREMIEYYMLPKLVAFSESAWAPERTWESMADRAEREQAMQEAWNVMANCLGQRELPRLARLRGGYNYRVPPPGGIIQEGTLKANASLPGLSVHFTTDDSEPTLDSPVYQSPIKVSGPVWLRSFDSAGRGSRSVRVSGMAN
jgi:hexosaminidase